MSETNPNPNPTVDPPQDPPSPPEPPRPANLPAPNDPPSPEGKVFTEDYVKALREESKNHRLGKNVYAGMLRQILGLKEEDEITQAAVTAYIDGRAKEKDGVLQQANNRLISAAILGKSGYDAKLIDRLLTPELRAKLTVTDTGEVQGLDPILEELEKDFPQIKTGNPAPPGPNPPGGKNKPPSVQEEYQNLIAELKKHPNDQSLLHQLFLVKEKMKSQ